MHIVIYAESYIQAVCTECYLAECRGAEEEEVSGFEKRVCMRGIILICSRTGDA
jgi:hypothetical protein